jgi:hypothetical protein
MSEIIVPYTDMQFVWISGHYDVHLTGLCCYAGRLASFEIVDWDADAVSYRIIQLGPIQRLCWLSQKKLFEWCVGYHCTYPYRGQGHLFYRRKPAWLHRLTQYTYYRVRGFKVPF